ncbi:MULTISPECIES: hypothetical protein [Bacillus]|jgi:hypothetical protein|uniref:Uncharacterized protein n=1 Tax=Bacillus cereus TaxID=1396 RepID=A0A9X6B878_BACCE|nr:MULTISPECIES: hypothetical protein [Bacillus cereus group]MBG9522355.1 hypothetical protein [Bacillus thuringiensis]MCQ6287862.1 hypothetical protein [Bacillus cereus]MCQ6315965.1 hypothetical protein [Bacillus cereus]MCQ6327841.1 hypothetical protein [Bacillus cereus]MCQ6339927.1 hypothetical protein [Bacillus cereus]
MKRWARKHKKVLITFGVISLVTWIGTAIELHLLATHTYDLYEYTTNHVVSDELKMVSLLGVVIIVLLAIWTFFLLFIFLKIMFPNKKSWQGALCMEEFRFLKEMPGALRKGLDKNE